MNKAEIVFEKFAANAEKALDITKSIVNKAIGNKAVFTGLNDSFKAKGLAEITKGEDITQAHVEHLFNKNTRNGKESYGLKKEMLTGNEDKVNIVARGAQEGAGYDKNLAEQAATGRTKGQNASLNKGGNKLTGTPELDMISASRTKAENQADKIKSIDAGQNTRNSLGNKYEAEHNQALAERETVLKNVNSSKESRGKADEAYNTFLKTKGTNTNDAINKASTPSYVATPGIHGMAGQPTKVINGVTTEQSKNIQEVVSKRNKSVLITPKVDVPEPTYKETVTRAKDNAINWIKNNKKKTIAAGVGVAGIGAYSLASSGGNQTELNTYKEAALNNSISKAEALYNQLI